MRPCVSSWPPVICAFFLKPQVIIDRHWLEVSLRSEFDDILCHFSAQTDQNCRWFVCAVGKSFSQLNSTVLGKYLDPTLNSLAVGPSRMLEVF